MFIIYKRPFLGTICKEIAISWMQLTPSAIAAQQVIIMFLIYIRLYTWAMAFPVRYVKCHCYAENLMLSHWFC
jgi:hypothetical protein